MKRLIAILLTVLLAAALHSCLDTIPTPGICSVTVTVDAGRTASLRIEPETLGSALDRAAARWLSLPAAFAYIPSAVEDIRVTVTGGDMATVTATEHVAGLELASVTVNVQVGLSRFFLVEGLSAAGDPVWHGQATVDVTGDALTVPITMLPGAVTTPTVIATDPADGATGVPLRPVITATFSEPMDERTITTSVFTVTETVGGQAVAGSVIVTAATASFTPLTDLTPNRDYTVTITTAARSAYGIPLAQDHVWIFTTVPPVPAVIATSPGAGETGVALNAVVTAAFSEPMDPATIGASTFLLSGTTGSTTYDVASKIAIYTPSAPLASGATYTATITTGARSSMNVPLAQDHVWSFTTGTVADTTAPSFGGLSLVTSLSLTTMELSWSPAVDDVTPASSIVFLVYQATASGGEDFLHPTYQTAPGATSYQVTGLTAGTTYFFVVRARDEAGNIDSNLVERSASYPGLFVDVVSGSDSSGDGTEMNPFKTITHALSVTTGSLPVYIAAGRYDTAAGEVFPLQLKPATMLVCRGVAQSSIIDAEGSSADALYGNAGSGAENCTVIPERGMVGIDDRIGGAGGQPSQITVRSTVINGPAGQAVVFSANSSFLTSTITGTDGIGIVIAAGRPAISESTVRAKQVGIRIDADTDPSIDGNMIESNGIGVTVTAAGGRPSVRNNTISNNATGILVSGGAPLIHKNEVKTNTIAGNDVGIEIAGGMPTVSFNTVTSNMTGILVSGGVPSIKSNSIFCNSTADLHVLVISAIDAKINSWDHEPPTLAAAPCVPGTDICYTGDPAGLPLYTPYGSAAAGACP